MFKAWGHSTSMYTVDEGRLLLGLSFFNSFAFWCCKGFLPATLNFP